MPKFIFYLIIFADLIPILCAEKILVGFAADAVSHVRTMMPLINRLAENGHKVTIFNAVVNPNALSFGPNVSTITLKLDVPKDLMEKMGQMMWSQTFHGFLLPFITYMASTGVKAFRNDFSEQVRQTLNGNFDLVIVCELFNTHTYAFAEMLSHHHNVPYIIFAPTTIIAQDAHSLSLGQNWATVPHLFSTEPKYFDDNFDVNIFTTRLVNTLEFFTEHLGSILTESFILPSVISILNVDKYVHSEFVKRSSMFITDNVDYISFPSAKSVDVRSVTSICSCSKPLPQEYLNFIEDPKSKGTIYVAFGTFVPWDFAPTSKKKEFFKALSKLTDYRIIFSFKGKFPDNVPSHVRLVKWAPQFDVLSHPKTKIFLTHGGLKSVKESLCSETPMLVMPIFAEQTRNAKLIIKNGIGGSINKYTLNSEEMYLSLKRILDDSQYNKRITKLKRIFLDRPIADLQDSTHYISRILRRSKGKTDIGGVNLPNANELFFKRVGSELSLFAFWHFELVLFVGTIILFISRK